MFISLIITLYYKGLIQRISSEDGQRSCREVAEVKDDGSTSGGKLCTYCTKFYLCICGYILTLLFKQMTEWSF